MCIDGSTVADTAASHHKTNCAEIKDRFITYTYDLVLKFAAVTANLLGAHAITLYGVINSKSYNVHRILGRFAFLGAPYFAETMVAKKSHFKSSIRTVIQSLNLLKEFCLLILNLWPILHRSVFIKVSIQCS